MPNTFDPANSDKLDDPARFSGISPEKLLLAAGLRPRDILLDIGCGTGLFSLAAARVTGPGGKVYALDTSSNMLAMLRTRLASAGIYNVEAVEISEAGLLNLPAETGTMALLADVLHEADDAGKLLDALHAALRPGARLAILEWKPKPTPMGPPAGHRLAAGKIKTLLENSGFTAPAVTSAEENHDMYLSKKI